MLPLDLIRDICLICSRISRCIDNVQANKEQCQRLGHRLKIIVDTLSGLTKIEDTEAFLKALSDLRAHMEECEAFIKEFTSKKGLARIFKSGKYKREFERLNRGLEEDLLQLNVGINVQQLMNHDDDEIDRRKDTEELLGKQDEILKLVGEETEKLDDMRQAQVDIFAFLREKLHRPSVPSEVAPFHILIEAEEIECGAKIAQGASVICRGRCRGQDVAVKRFEQVLDDVTRTQFEREVQILERLRSDHVVFFYGACLKLGKECLVMKYMAHGSLSEALEKKQSFTPEQQKRVALEIAKGLNYLHSQGMIHRDLNDRHVLFDDDWHAKLTGFGLSKVRSSSIQSAAKMRELSVWSAPELFLRSACHTSKSDVYSYGLILWELLTEQPPCLRLGHCECIPETTPKIYADIILQCWEKDPSKRPSLEVIVREIEAYTPRPKSPAAEELYKSGLEREAKHDYGEAAAYYTRSAAKGCVQAKANLGMFFLQGTGAPADKIRAFALLSEAAAIGQVRAQFNLGQMLEYGDGVKKDYKQALVWYQKAAMQGDEEAKGRVEHLIEKMKKAATLDEAHTMPKP